MTPTPSQEERREAIARIVDPAPFEDGRWMDFEDGERKLSMAKAYQRADAILALDPPTFPVSEDEARECLAAHVDEWAAAGIRSGHAGVWSIRADKALKAMLAFAAFRGSGVAPEASGAPLRGQALGPADPEPVPVSALPGDDPSRLSLHGALSHTGSQRGERYFQIEIAEPYHHSAFIIVYGDEGREGDDDLTDDIAPFDGNVATILCTINQYGDLVTTPKKMVLFASGIEAAVADETRSGSAEGESPVSEAETPNPDPQNTPDPTPLSGKD